MMAMRPLSAGEILDRAVTLFVRAFIPIVTVAAVLYIPIFVLEGLLAGGSIDAIVHSVGRPGAQPDLPPSFFAAYFSTLLLFNIVPLLVQTAVCVTVDGAYRGEVVALGAAYRQSLRRFWHQLAASLLFGAALAGVLYFLIFVVFAIGFVGALSHLPVLAEIIGGVVLGVIGLAIVVVLIAWGYFGYALAALSIALGRNNFINALLLSFRTILAPAHRWRALTAGFIVFAVLLVSEIIAAAIAALFIFVVKIPQIAIALPGVIVILATCFLTTYVIAFAYDLKVRSQGFDLELEMAATHTVSPA
jgi:hypothetical protein